MKRFFIKQNKNGGFTLIELLIAVVILGIVVSPLLQAMITAARTTVRSRSVGNATLTAQNVMEVVQAERVASLLTTGYRLFGKDANAAAFTPPSPDLNAGPVTLKWDNVEGAGSSEQFDVSLKIDPVPYAALNASEVSSFSPMDILLMQPETLSENPDHIAASEFANAALTCGGIVTNPPGLYGFDAYKAYFLKHFSRTISLELKRDDNGTAEVTDDVVTLTASYQYKTSFTYEAEDIDINGVFTGGYIPVVEKPVYTWECAISAAAGNVKPCVYFSFFPNLATVSAINENSEHVNDILKIRNPDNLEATVFLIKQNPANDPAAPSLDLGYGYVAAPDESTYKPRVELYEDHIHARDMMHASVLSNLKVPLDEAATLLDVDVTYYRYVTSSNTWRAADEPLSGELVNRISGMRLFEVTVEVSKDGEALYTLQGTKLSPA